MNNSECHIFHVNLNLFFPETILCKLPIPVPPHLHFPSETYVPILVISSMVYVIFQYLFLCVWVMFHFDEPFSQPSILLFFPLLARCFRNLTPRIEHTWLIYKGTLSFIFSLCLVHQRPPDQYHVSTQWSLTECMINEWMHHLQGHWVKEFEKKVIATYEYLDSLFCLCKYQRWVISYIYFLFSQCLA